VKVKVALIIGMIGLGLNSATYGIPQITSLSLNTLLHFGSGFTNGNPELSTNFQKVNLNNSQNAISILGAGFSSIGQTLDQFDSGNVKADADNDENLAPQVIGKALCYPNPFRQTTGGELGYRLNKNTDIEIQVYDMLANMIIKKSFKKGSKGAQKGYNKLTINLDTFDGYSLSTGVYFYYIINEGKILSKGKMAVIP